MPQRQEPPEAHTPVSKPGGPTLSEQERQDLDTAARGIDTAASALPDDGPPPAPPRAPDPDPAANKRAAGPEKSRADAQNKGLLPTAGESGPPLDGQ